MDPHGSEITLTLLDIDNAKDQTCVLLCSKTSFVVWAFMAIVKFNGH